MEVQDVFKYLKIVRKWWWAIALLFVATVGTMLAIAFLTEASYEATVTVQVSAPPPQEAPLFSEFSWQALRTEIEYTRASLSEVLLEGDIPYRVLEALPDVHMTAGELHDKMEVETPDNSQLMHVRVRAPDAETAALLANKVAEVGLQRYGQLLAQPTANTREFIERQLEAAKEELGTAEAQLTQFQIENKIGDLDSATKSQYELLRSLKGQRDLERAAGNVAKAQAIDETILEREVELQNLIGLSAEYYAMVDYVEQMRSFYNFLFDKKTEAQIKEDQILELGSIQIITSARPPLRPVAAISNKLIVLGAVASLLTGVLLTFLLEYLEVSGAFRGFQSRSQRSETTVLADR
jgi:uncharacterized protein involved in exopolysaccharide biosynthesis